MKSARQFLHAMLSAFGVYSPSRFSFYLPNLKHMELLPLNWTANIRPWQRRRLETERTRRRNCR